ncbi:MAG: hypothetical protein KGD59_02435 [Candidatus Heimdallarchaeota archaeon]|nr:hypothetical protein [Candidatus Heimdallarchaeota archaeon]MBY8993379.1 hypothetical protein [Candidatus Heimdallarchaeota archaeon]
MSDYGIRGSDSRGTPIFRMGFRIENVFSRNCSSELESKLKGRERAVGELTLLQPVGSFGTEAEGER